MIGIYGGTFDPVHYGHLRTGLEVKEALGLDELRFLPCREPPHRAVPGATPEQRLAMLKLALTGAEPGLRVDTRELERPGPSYMIDTLASLRAESAGRPLCLVLGIDAFRGLPAWHRWQELTEFAHVVVMRRPDVEADEPDAGLEDWVNRHVTRCGEDLRRRPAGLVHFIRVSQIAISATAVRALVHAGGNPRYLLPDSVLDYMREQRLYQN
ncbi:nicotinate-nucleotide adenylyltransferase [Methylococcus sp. EFPC2]|uniref:nicotinate-nucleotide adenylyltransferase n=1 Tax=Methylococcus sp. EFPC2 TaxID=2812648 RepID=UPI0019687B57|nr:nicotinate-nucleotide adenylyltransferase [Methylococcus sp. EFPC2]QSA98654.1 nicotinate-nucleotide adenylyltransferase [Methylococcus sp. EFPC2]